MVEPGIILLVIAAVVPFGIALGMCMPVNKPEVPSRIDPSGITVFPTCVHCGWKGEIDATSYIEDAPDCAVSIAFRSPPCGRCGRRWEIDLTALRDRLRAGKTA